jgi:hypothetical protein
VNYCRFEVRMVYCSRETAREMSLNQRRRTRLSPFFA